MEKYLENPRHVEIQVLADSHRNAIYLGERDCSMQRRHQKILEEAPAARHSLPAHHAHRRTLRRSLPRINYRGAGTFEFLYENGEFYFIEMNTRIQVEHPVTEMITGIDIVQEQIRVAAGEKLRFRQREVEFPRTRHRMPHQRRRSLHVRAISRQDRALSPARRPRHPGRFAHLPGLHRTAALRFDGRQGHRLRRHPRPGHPRMRIALSEMSIDGIKTNIALHQELMHDANFIKGGTNIHYLEKKLAARSEMK
jgi:acetyl-CoA carboxylase biotin carboxylase subunit